jgi:uncharacterized membrane protein YbhN (UPF0104 family)
MGFFRTIYKSALQTFIYLALGVLFLILLYAADLIDFKAIIASTQRHPDLVGIIATTHIGVILFVSIRYYFTLRAFGLLVSPRHVIAACVVALSIGPWLPGSPLVVEALRLSFMLSDYSASKVNDGLIISALANPNINTIPVSLRTRIVSATGIDALIGLFMYFLVGLGAGIAVILFHPVAISSEIYTVCFLLAVGTIGVGAIILFPKIKIVRSLVRLIIGRISHFRKRRYKLRRVRKILISFSKRFDRIGYAILTFLDRPSALLPVILTGLPIPILNGLGLFYSARAVDVDIGLIPILTIYPVLVIGSLLPIGLAGIGGYQLIGIAIFSIFAIPAKAVTSSELLHTAIILMLNAVIILPFIPKIIFTLRQSMPKPISKLKGDDTTEEKN